MWGVGPVLVCRPLPEEEQKDGKGSVASDAGPGGVGSERLGRRFEVEIELISCRNQYLCAPSFLAPLAKTLLSL